uniref:BTB domain-containing protein n=1 Tax=Amblyomma maculatum TaxID=34609 RepID=G3MPV2_AMBMU
MESSVRSPSASKAPLFHPPSRTSPSASMEATFMKNNKERFLDNKALSDVVFILRPGSDRVPRTVHAHRQYLAMSNEMFYTKFYLNEPDETQFNIDDVHPDGFYGLLKYLYSGMFRPITFEEAMFTREAAKHYHELELIKESTKYIVDNLTPERVCPLLDCLDTRDLTIIDKEAITMLKNSGTEVLRSDTFVKCSDTTLNVVLDVVGNVTEKFVFDSVEQWAIEKSRKVLHADGTLLSREDAMRPFLPQLRLLNLSPKDYVSGPGKLRKLLTDHDNYAILGNIVEPASLRLPPWTNRDYNTRSQFHTHYRIYSSENEAPDSKLPPRSSRSSVSSKDGDSWNGL